MNVINVYHTQEFRLPYLEIPIFADGNEQWLGDGFYFWHDEEFATWWGHAKKCKRGLSQFSVYKATLIFSNDDFIDTVFNEADYLNFVENVEKFAKKYQTKFRIKPTLEEFNDFIADYNIWDEIKVIRFQEVPPKNEFVEVKDFFYKKRIQYRVNDAEIITTFAHLKNRYCV